MPASDDRTRDGIGYAFLDVFAKDRAIDPDELALIEQVARRDDVADDDERLYLGRVFRRIQRWMVAPEVWDEIQHFQRRHGV